MPTPTVFISYSHQDEKWMKTLLPQLHALEQAGVDMRVWHDRRIDGGDKWYPEIQEAIANAAAAILLISPDFLASRFCIQEEVPALLNRQENESMLLIPVLLRKCPWKAHRWLKDRQMLPRDGKCVAIDFVGDLADDVFAAVAEQVLSHFEHLANQPAVRVVVPAPVQRLAKLRPVTEDLRIVPPPPVVPWPTLPVERIDLTRLPETGSALFGRNEELALLDQAWASPENVSTVPVRILTFTAHGGVGKSTLVNHWLAEMARDHYRGATRIFGWSFYSQGVREETAGSADTFIDAALHFFGDPDPTAGSPWDKGARLAHLVGSQRALLVLDGLEPLQSPHRFERGKLRDRALESLLRNLARQSAGLCLITTREPLTDLAGRSGVTMRDLEQIDPQAGRALLRTARVVGTDADLESLARRFGPHALAVSLLGVYLHEQPGHGIGPASALEQLPGKDPTYRVLAGFEQWLGDGPEREALRLLGFFDRPADAGCLRAFRIAPRISGLNEHLVSLGDAEWDRVLTRLEKLRLIHVQRDKRGQQTVDAHPLIREYFAELLKNGEIWREGHRRLYEHLCATTKEGDQPKLEDLQPLYHAVAHGCLAGMHQEACDKVYHDRIQRRDEAYSAHKLGAFGSDLGAVACFFEQPWSRLSPALVEDAQAWLLSVASFDLRALGRLTEALEPMRASREMCVQQENWKEASIRASNLTELKLTLGEVAGAVKDAEQSVAYADRSGNALHRMISRAMHADALHEADHRPEAQARFREAEDMQAEVQPDLPLLYSLRGFHYCDMFLAVPERATWQTILQLETRNSELETAAASCRTVSHRAVQTLQWAESWQEDILTIALDHLTLGRAALYEAILEGASLAPCHSSIHHAVDDLRRAGDTTRLPHGLLTRAWLRSLTGARTGPESAQSDLDEAWEIAERGPMRLHMADIHLHRARLFFREKPYPWKSPQDDLAAAEKLINDCGYHRRDDELADAKRAILKRET